MTLQKWSARPKIGKIIFDNKNIFGPRKPGDGSDNSNNTANITDVPVGSLLSVVLKEMCLLGLGL